MDWPLPPQYKKRYIQKVYIILFVIVLAKFPLHTSTYLKVEALVSSSNGAKQSVAVFSRIPKCCFNHKYTSVIEFGQQTHAIAIEFTLELL